MDSCGPRPTVCPPFTHSFKMYTTRLFFQELKAADKTRWKACFQFMMKEFGMSLQCNRFDVGNSNEAAIADVIKRMGRRATVHTNAKRIDIEVEDAIKFSIKYSSTGNIRLHNSLGSNRDLEMTDTLLVTPTEWWFLDTALMAEHGVAVADYLKNCDDCLELRRKVLTHLRKAKYPLMFEFVLDLPTTCKNRPTYEVFYEYVCAQVPE
jgi:hypothetical protein